MLVFVTIIASFSLSQVYGEPIIFDDEYVVEKFVSGLEYPTTMTFVGEDILILEKNTGKVILIQDGNGVVNNKVILDLPVNFVEEGGLLGIAFASDHIYLYFTESLSGFDKSEPEDIRNVVYQYDWDGEKLTNPILIKEFIALDTGHPGGVITKGQDNEIYFVIGDHDQETIYQNIPVNTIHETSSIFKIDTKQNNSIELFAIGIRNSFGLAVDSVTGYLWDTENGELTFDEINLVNPRFNSGYKIIMGPSDRVDFGAINSTLNPKPFENFVYSDPEFSWYRTIGITAIAFPDKNNFKKYSDSVFVGDYNNGRIYKFQLNVDRTGFVFYNQELSDLVLDDGDAMDKILFGKDFQGITDIKFHDDAMYVISILDGSIYKIYAKNILPPLKQYQNDITHKKIVCKAELMPIVSKSGYINCVYPKTAITLINVLNWSVEHPEMPKIELKFQNLSGLNFEYINLSDSDFRWSNFYTTMISNVNFTRTNLSYTDLSGKDLTGTILTEADLTNANLSGVDLSGKDLTGTILTEADLTNVNLSGVDLSGKDLTGTILRGVDLTNVNLSGVDLSNANLSGIDLTNANLSGIDLTNANLSGVDISGKDLTGTILRGVDLSGKDLTGTILTEADLTNANLSGVDLSGKDLTGTILTEADLTNANLSGVDLSHSNLTGVVLTGIDLTNANLSGVDLSGKDLTGTILTEADLTNVNLSGVDLSGKDLTGTILTEADLTNVNLSGVDLSYSNLTGVVLTGIDLTNANLSGVDLSGKDLSNTILINANLENATLESAKLLDANLDSTNLTNADLRNTLLADTNLSNAILVGADLTNAVLTGAILIGADLENAVLTNTILNCVGHPICFS